MTASELREKYKANLVARIEREINSVIKFNEVLAKDGMTENVVKLSCDDHMDGVRIKLLELGYQVDKIEDKTLRVRW